MNAFINSSLLAVGLLTMVAMIVSLVLYNRRRLKPQIAAYASQRMCPSCGLITPKSRADCVECGKPLGLR
jgi:hypothetical protein